jgi:hypothetical protein
MGRDSFDSSYDSFCAVLDGWGRMVDFQCQLARAAFTMHGHREAIGELGALPKVPAVTGAEEDVLDQRARMLLARHTRDSETFGPCPEGATKTPSRLSASLSPEA